MSNNAFQTYGFNEAKSSPHKEYFSGANVKVYFGDVWIDQLAGISFSLQESVQPIFGFRSHTFDRVSRGSRYVQGEFILNFTENGYLQSILDRVASNMKTVENQIRADQDYDIVTNLTPERNIQALLSTKGDDIYAQQIEALKQSFWGGESNFVPTTEKKENDTFYYAERNGEENALLEHGFNILIDYSPDANLRDFEDCLNQTKDKRSFYDTFRSIVGVHLTGEGQAIYNNGQIIQHSFQFLARDLDGDITIPSLINNFRTNQLSLGETNKNDINWAHNPYSTQRLQ